MNGHNVRLLSIDGDVVALTRGGFICPYSTEVAARLLPADVFEKNPRLVLCGEMVGPENPYVPKDVYPTDTIDFYLFDIAQKNRKGTCGVQKTHEFAQEFGLKTATFLGEFTIRPNVPYIKVSSDTNSSTGGTDGTSRGYRSSLQRSLGEKCSAKVIPNT